MNPIVLAAVTLLPAIPAAVGVVRAIRKRSDRWSRSIIVLGALTIATGVAAYTYVAISVFPAVANAAPEKKASLLATGLARGNPALTAGLIVGALLCVVGGITRSAFRPDVEPAPRRKAAR
jgi:hypothetical protein